MPETLNIIDKENSNSELHDVQPDIHHKMVIPFGEAMGVKIDGRFPSSPLDSKDTFSLTGGDADGKNKDFDDPDKD